VAAISIDRATDVGGDQSRDQKAYRESAHGERDRPAAISRDQGHNQDRRVKDRAPRNYLGDAKHRHGSPRPGEDIAQPDHSTHTHQDADPAHR
jgi:hypothetical protein